jgi:hypothetical protein
MTSLSAVWGLMAPFTMMALGTAPQVDTPDPSPPTAIEQALVERACSGVTAGRTFENDPHAQCLSAQLVSLRNDFGRDLRRLSASERNMLDSTCSRVQTSQGREAYLDCITGQLTALRNRRNRAKGAAAEPTPLAAPLGNAPPPETTPAQQGSPRTAMIIGGALLTIAAVAVGALVVIGNRRKRRTCRECGAAVPDSGDLCSNCRRSAAEALRRVATERLAQERAADEQQRKQRAQEEEHRRQAALKEEEARLRVLEEARQREEEARRREEEARRQTEETLRRCQVASVESRPVDEFDPYAVLGVPRDTTQERIRAAYEEAKSKYDHENVAHLGVDIQDYYQAKAEAVDRAYQMLAG